MRDLIVSRLGIECEHATPSPRFSLSESIGLHALLGFDEVGHQERGSVDGHAPIRQQFIERGLETYPQLRMPYRDGHSPLAMAPKIQHSGTVHLAQQKREERLRLERQRKPIGRVTHV